MGKVGFKWVFMVVLDGFGVGYLGVIGGVMEFGFERVFGWLGLGWDVR